MVRRGKPHIEKSQLNPKRWRCWREFDGRVLTGYGETPARAMAALEAQIDWIRRFGDNPG